MAVLFTITKLFHLGMPLPSRPGLMGDYIRDVLFATAADNAFALGAGAFAAIILLALSRWPRVRATAWSLFLIVFTIFTLYAVISAFVFAYTMVPITRPLLQAAGDWGNLRSSVMAYVGRRTAEALIAAPLAYVVLAILTSKMPGVPRSWIIRVVQGLLIVGVLAQVAFARGAQPGWARRPDHWIALNPHWTLISSGALGGLAGPMKLPPDVPPEYDADFLPFRERGVATDPGHAVTRPAQAVSTGGYALPFDAAHPPRNVIVYVLESTGTQFLSLYGSQFGTTPRLRAEAAHSLVYDHVTCHVGMTPSSLVAINSSNFPRPVWVPDEYEPLHPLNQPGILLSRVLKQHGYRTLALTAADFSFGHQREFLDGQFDTIWDKRDLPAPQIVSWGTTDASMVDKLIGWIDAGRSAKSPFFALCWTNQTHHPYTLSPGQAERDMGGRTMPRPADGEVVNRYLNCLREEDRQLGRLLDALRARKLADDTLVVITGDHGEGFNWPHLSLGHGFRIYQENVNVPCVFWNPRLFSPGQRLATVGSHIDLAPTITDILGFAPAGTWQGHSLFDPHRPPRAYFYGANTDYLLGLREGDWKYIYDATTGYDELYDLKSDPLELKDVSSQYSESCRIFRRRVAAWARYLSTHGAGVKP